MVEQIYFGQSQSHVLSQINSFNFVQQCDHTNFLLILKSSLFKQLLFLLLVDMYVIITLGEPHKTPGNLESQLTIPKSMSISTYIFVYISSF